MPEGRFLSRSVANDWELNNVSFWADYLFTRCVPHLDREGRLPGHPAEVKGIAAPLRLELTVEMIDVCLGELAEVGLVDWYVVADRPCLSFPGFPRHQKGLRKDREAESRLPAPKGALSIRSALRSRSGVDPELVRLRTGAGPAQVEVEVQVEVQEPPPAVVVPGSPIASAPASAALREGDCRNGFTARAILQESCFRGRETAVIEGQELGLGLLVTDFNRLLRAGFAYDDLVHALSVARVLPPTHEDRAPDGPFTLAWLARPLEGDPDGPREGTRVLRLVSEFHKRNAPTGSKAAGPTAVGELVHDQLAAARSA